MQSTPVNSCRSKSPNKNDYPTGYNLKQDPHQRRVVSFTESYHALTG
jgi:hypothetical protein